HRHLRSFPTRRSSDLVLAGARVATTLVAPEQEFLLRPATVGEPFDRARARSLSLAEVAREEGAALVHGELAGVDVARHLVMHERSEEHTSELQSPYDL